MVIYTLKNNKQFQLIISVLFVCALFISSSFSANVGYETVYSINTTIKNRRAQPVTMPEDGDITSITMYHTGGSGRMILAVYNDYYGHPDIRLGVTAVTNVSSSTGWQTINLTSPASVSAGETIWLAWVYESNPGIRYKSGTPGRAHSSSTWSGGMPASFGSSSITSYVYSIYATYTTSTSVPPVVSGIPDQTVYEGEDFETINLVPCNNITFV